MRFEIFVYGGYGGSVEDLAISPPMVFFNFRTEVSEVLPKTERFEIGLGALSVLEKRRKKIEFVEEQTGLLFPGQTAIGGSRFVRKMLYVLESDPTLFRQIPHAGVV